MKTIKFRKRLADLIVNGSKTVTWRLFDDKNLQVGDIVTLRVWETQTDFATAQITAIREKRLGDTTDEDYVGHEKFKDNKNMISHYKLYYGDRVNEDTLVKIINFNLQK